MFFISAWHLVILQELESVFQQRPCGQMTQLENTCDFPNAMWMSFISQLKACVHGKTSST